MADNFNAEDTCRFSVKRCSTSAYFEWMPILKEIIDTMKSGNGDHEMIIRRL